MPKNVWHAADAAASVLIGVGIGVATNVVTAKWSWTWGLALAALASSLVALEAVRSLRSGGSSDPESGGISTVGRRAVLGIAMASLVAVFALVWLAPRADDRPGTSCHHEPFDDIKDLAYRCTMDRWRPDSTIPVFPAARPGADFGKLHKRTGREQYFVCELPGARVTLDADPEVQTTHWALTLADEPVAWGVVPEFYFEDGGSGVPDRALPTCSTAQIDKIGDPYP
jgi:hypothetical protein